MDTQTFFANNIYYQVNDILDAISFNEMTVDEQVNVTWNIIDNAIEAITKSQDTFDGIDVDDILANLLLLMIYSIETSVNEHGFAVQLEITDDGINIREKL